MKESLFEKLMKYAQSDIYPFCMPGHKRQNRLPALPGAKPFDPYQLDITEVEGFDDLHRAKGILKDITDHASEVYARLDPAAQDAGQAANVPAGQNEIAIKAPAVFMSVNGSTACNLAAVNAMPEEGPVLIAANCHRSVFHGAKISNRKVIELAPQWISPLAIYGGISPQDVENAFRGYPDIKALVITSPSYEGFVSDVQAIANIVHAHGAYLIVDEAHGAHLPFCKDLPASAIYLGADIVIHSLHKTVGSLNQTALAFVNRDELKEPFHEKLLLFTTTSPSYLLMASIEQAILWAEANPEAFDDYYQRLSQLRKDLQATCGKAEWIHRPEDKACPRALSEKNDRLCVIDKSIVGTYNIFDLDEAKLLFYKKGMSGEALYRSFYHDFRLQFEKYGDRYALAMTTVWDTPGGFSRLLEATKRLSSAKGVE